VEAEVDQAAQVLPAVKVEVVVRVDKCYLVMLMSPRLKIKLWLLLWEQEDQAWQEEATPDQVGQEIKGVNLLFTNYQECICLLVEDKKAQQVDLLITLLESEEAQARHQIMAWMVLRVEDGVQEQLS
jgi:hypothetical protein